MNFQEIELEVFFGGNIEDVAEVAQQFYQLPNYLEIAVSSEESMRKFEKSGVTGKIAVPNPDLLPENLAQNAQTLIRKVRRQVPPLYKGHRYLEAIQFAGYILEKAELLEDDDRRGVKLVAYEQRGMTQAFLADMGWLKGQTSTLRSFACLSAATDLMRSDIESSYYTDLIRPVTVAFGDAGMGDVQHLMSVKIANSLNAILGSKSTVLTIRDGQAMDFSKRPSDPALQELEGKILEKIGSSKA